MKKLRDTVQKRFPTLPEDIKVLVASDTLIDRIDAVARKNALDEWDADAIIETTTRLLIGDISPSQYVISLSDELGVPREQGARIAQEINRDVFNVVKESLKQVHGLNEGAGKTPGVTGGAKPSQLSSSMQKIVGMSPIAPKQGALQGGSPQPATTAPQQISTPPPVATPASAAPSAPKAMPATPVPPAGAQPVPGQNIFEQKLGGAFRMKSDTVAYKPKEGASTPPPQTPPTPTPADPYREAP